MMIACDKEQEVVLHSGASINVLYVDELFILGGNSKPTEKLESIMSSLISILSTEHGRLRREQRDIDKRDLYKAIKLGRIERCWGQRWKIEYDGIIFIVNNNMTQEVTAFPSPLALAPIDTEAKYLDNRTRILLERKPELCTSHTVLVVDTSGSMTTHDINLHRDRQVAAYSITAMEFVAEQIFQQTATNSDIVSVIEFNSNAQEVISREPISWTLYNKLLDRRDRRDFKAREYAREIDDSWYGDTNYLPALEAADKALGYIDHDRCALSLFFLSDGSPTDSRSMGLTPMAAMRLMADKITQIAIKYEEKLNIQMVGFGSACSDFSTLEHLVEAAKLTESGTMAEFTYCGKVADKIGSTITSLASSTCATRTQLLSHDRDRKRIKRKILLESEAEHHTSFNFYEITGHYIYDPCTDEFIPFGEVPPGAFLGGESQYNLQALSKKAAHPPFLALGRLPYGKGAERLAFRCNLAHSDSEETFAFNPMVAKETILVERPADNFQFHEAFCKTQSLASYLAFQFCQRLRALPWYDEAKTPCIIFLPCSVLILDDPDWKDRRVLVEKKLNTEKYGWRNYNDNAGGLDGKQYHAPINVEREFAKLDGIDDIILEEGSEEEDLSDDDDDDDDENVSKDDEEVEDKTNNDESTGFLSQKEEEVEPTDYIQAFTHFTYLYSNRRAMVCDLQGVYNSDMTPPTFELTDPAIHYKSKSGKSNVFGRTDLGQDGMDLFFDTHKCNQVCKMMRLSRKNKNWQKQWRGKPL